MAGQGGEVGALAVCGRLNTIDLRGSAVWGRVGPLAALAPSLVSLDLSATAVHGEIAPLANCTFLDTLHLAQTAVWGDVQPLRGVHFLGAGWGNASAGGDARDFSACSEHNSSCVDAWGLVPRAESMAGTDDCACCAGRTHERLENRSTSFCVGACAAWANTPLLSHRLPVQSCRSPNLSLSLSRSPSPSLSPSLSLSPKRWRLITTLGSNLS